MWPFNKTKNKLLALEQKIPAVEEKLDEVRKQLLMVMQTMSSGFKNLYGEVDEAEGRLKKFLGIKNYEKTQQDRVVFLDNSLLADVLNGLKELRYEISKLKKDK